MSCLLDRQEEDLKKRLEERHLGSSDPPHPFCVLNCCQIRKGTVSQEGGRATFLHTRAPRQNLFALGSPGLTLGTAKLIGLLPLKALL